MDYLGSVCQLYRKKYQLSQVFYDSTSCRWSPWFRRLSRGLGTFFPSMLTAWSGAVQRYCSLPNIQDEKDIEAEYEQSRCDGKERRQKKAPMKLFISHLGQPAVKNFKPPWNERGCYALAIFPRCHPLISIDKLINSQRFLNKETHSSCILKQHGAFAVKRRKGAMWYIHAIFLFPMYAKHVLSWPLAINANHDSTLRNYCN